VIGAFWVFTTLRLFELADPARTAMRAVLDARLQVGDLDVAVSRLLVFPAVVIVTWLTARTVVFALEEDVYPRLELPRGVPYALSSLVWYGLLLAGFLLALGTLGLDLTRITVLVSAFGLGLGFGMQQIINNFVSGLILLFERPVQVGDSVQLGDLSGQMLRIGIRSSTIRTGDGAEVIVPNSKLIDERVTNWTLSDRRRRVDLDLRVPDGSDAERVLALLVDVARRDPRVMKDPEPESLLISFGDSALQFQLRVWTEDPRWMRLRSDLGVALQHELREAQIGTPG
jgi:potassium efflux system protein